MCVPCQYVGILGSNPGIIYPFVAPQSSNSIASVSSQHAGCHTLGVSDIPSLLPIRLQQLPLPQLFSQQALPR